MEWFNSKDLALLNIYESFISSEWNYLIHLLLWMLPIVLMQWAAFFKILLTQTKAILITPLVLGIYLSLTDVVAVKEGIWFFDETQILGFFILGVPIEEWLFFYITALLVTQSFILFHWRLWKWKSILSAKAEVQ